MYPNWAFACFEKSQIPECEKEILNGIRLGVVSDTSYKLTSQEMEDTKSYLKRWLMSSIFWKKMDF